MKPIAVTAFSSGRAAVDTCDDVAGCGCGLVTGRSEYSRASFGDGDGVLGVRGVRPVCRAQGPAVGIDNQTITASCPPRFEREGHTRPQQQPAAMPPAVGDVGILVHGAT